MLRPFYAFVSRALCPNAKKNLIGLSPRSISEVAFSNFFHYCYLSFGRQSRETNSRLRGRLNPGCCLQLVYIIARFDYSSHSATKYCNREDPKSILYSIGITPARFPATQEQAKQALTPVITSSLAPCQPGKLNRRYFNAMQCYFLDLLSIESLEKRVCTSLVCLLIFRPKIFLRKPVRLFYTIFHMYAYIWENMTSCTTIKDCVRLLEIFKKSFLNLEY